MENASYRLGCDIGGTFTDFVLVNDETGEFEINKCLTTPADPSDAVEEGIRGLLERVPGFMPKINEIIHGTTLVINAIIERKGAKTALITTRGFRDVLEIGRELRYNLYDLYLKMPEPLVPRHLRIEITERLDKEGNVLTAIDPEEIRRVISDLKQDNIRALAICFLHSYTHDQHEREAAESVPISSVAAKTSPSGCNSKV